LPRLRARLRESRKREPSHAELAEKLGIKESDIHGRGAERNPYALGGFRIYDVSDRTKPKLLAFQKTGGIGVHRFDMDENYAYISTEMEGYLGNILVIYDIRNPEKPQEVSRWWMPGTEPCRRRKTFLGGKAPPAAPRAALRGQTVGRMAGMRGEGLDISIPPRTVGEYNYHPPFRSLRTLIPVRFEYPRIALGSREDTRTTRRKWSGAAGRVRLPSGARVTAATSSPLSIFSN